MTVLLHLLINPSEATIIESRKTMKIKIQKLANGIQDESDKH